MPGFNTTAIHSGFSHDPHTGATGLPIYASASFEYEDPQQLADVFAGRKFGHVYSRISNPTVMAFESRVTAMCNGIGTLAVATGMAALTIICETLCRSGDHIVASASVFGGTFQLLNEILNRRGISVSFVAPNSVEIEKSICENTRVILIESIGNPKLDVPNVAEISAVGSRYQIPVVLDSTLTPPGMGDPKAEGVALVMHSATKYFAAGGLILGGVIVDMGTFNWEKCRTPEIATAYRQFRELAFLAYARKHVYRNSGASLSPFHAFLFFNGLETIKLRMLEICRNAQALAEAMWQLLGPSRVTYPGLSYHPDFAIAKTRFPLGVGGMITIDAGTQQQAFDWISRLEIAKNLANLGDNRTLVIHPASTTHRELPEVDRIAAGALDGTVRISVGIEDSDDLVRDFTNAIGA